MLAAADQQPSTRRTQTVGSPSARVGTESATIICPTIEQFVSQPPLASSTPSSTWRGGPDTCGDNTGTRCVVLTYAQPGGERGDGGSEAVPPDGNDAPVAPPVRAAAWNDSPSPS